MAEVAFVKETSHTNSAILYFWEAVGDSAVTGTPDTCEPVKIPRMDDVTIYAIGNFSGITSVKLNLAPYEGAYVLATTALAESGGVEIAITSNGAKNVDQGAIWYQPILIGTSDGSTDVDIWLVAK